MTIYSIADLWDFGRCPIGVVKTVGALYAVGRKHHTGRRHYEGKNPTMVGCQENFSVELALE